MTNQYNSIIITDCRAVKICKVHDKCICKYKRGTFTCCCRAWFCCSERRPTMSMMASASASRAAIASVILLRSRSEYRDSQIFIHTYTLYTQELYSEGIT